MGSEKEGVFAVLLVCFIYLGGYFGSCENNMMVVIDLAEKDVKLVFIRCYINVRHLEIMQRCLTVNKPKECALIGRSSERVALIYYQKTSSAIDIKLT